MKKKGLKKTEKQILYILFINQSEMSVNEIAEEAEISWDTADSYLSKLAEKKYVLGREKRFKRKDGKIITKKYYKFNFKRYHELRKMLNKEEEKF